MHMAVAGPGSHEKWKNCISGLTFVCGAVGQAARSSQKRLEVEDGSGNGSCAEFPTIHQRCVSKGIMFDPKIHKQRFGCLYIVPLRKGDGHVIVRY